jgi:hypothetical protein
LLDEARELELVIRGNPRYERAKIRRPDVGHLDGALDRAGFAQGELEMEILTDLKRSFTLELKSFFCQIDDLTRNPLTTLANPACSIDRDSEQFPFLGHRSAYLSSVGQITHFLDAGRLQSEL